MLAIAFGLLFMMMAAIVSGFFISTTISMISIAINLSLAFQVLHRKCHKNLIYIAVTLSAVKPTLGPGIQESSLSYLCQM